MSKRCSVCKKNFNAKKYKIHLCSRSINAKRAKSVSLCDNCKEMIDYQFFVQSGHKYNEIAYKLRKQQFKSCIYDADKRLELFQKEIKCL